MDLAHYEAARNGNVNDLPFRDIGTQDMSNVLDKVSPLGNSLLHVAASSGNKEITVLLVRHHPCLVTKKNARGDTPLHVAARLGKLNTAIVLVGYAKEEMATNPDDGLLKTKNDLGNTPLHNALLALHAPLCDTKIKAAMKSFEIEALARYLISADSEMCYRQNKIGKSPLCMAVEFGYKEIVEYIMESLPETDDSYQQKLEGKSPVHVAIQRRKLDMLKLIMKLKPKLFLIRDIKWNTPLHSAASLGYLEGVQYLLEIKSDQVFERNNEGLYPLHLACENGHVRVMQQLLRIWSDPTELLSDKGWNILHVAAKSGKEEVVWCILKEEGIDIDKLINEVDKDGNTPFHLAALHCHSMVVASLLWDRRSNADLVNYQDQTAYDICVSAIPPKALDQKIEVKDGNLKDARNFEKNSAQVNSNNPKKEFEKMMTLSILYTYHEYFRRLCIRRHHDKTTKRLRTKNKPPTPKQDLNSTLNNLFVVAALIVGAAFNGVQVSFDGKNDTGHAAASNPTTHDENGEGMEVDLLHRFITSNVISMNLSITAAFTLCLAMLLDTTLATKLIRIAFFMLELALSFMGSAFLYAMFIRMGPYDLFLFSLYPIIVIFLYVQALLLTIPLLTLMAGWEVLPLSIYFVLFCFYFLLHRLQRLICFNRLKTLLKITITGSIFLALFFLAVYSTFYV